MWPPRTIANESALLKYEQPGSLGDRFLAGVDEIGIDLVLGRKRSDAEQPVLGVQRDVDARRNVVGDQRRHADAEVDVVAVFQLARDARDDAFANVHGYARTSAIGPSSCCRLASRVRFSMRFS